MDYSSLYERVCQSVVKVVIVNGGNIISTGSGSIINNGRHILTCSHCIHHAEGFFNGFLSDGGGFVSGNIIYNDPRSDISILEFESSIGKPVSYSSSHEKIGHEVFTIGYPLGLPLKNLSTGIISALDHAHGHIYIDGSINKGNSGGPLFNINGEQIGIINAKVGALSENLQKIIGTDEYLDISFGGISTVESIKDLAKTLENYMNAGIGCAISLHSNMPDTFKNIR